MSAHIQLYDKDHQVVWDSETSDQPMEDFLSDRLGLTILKRHACSTTFAGPLRILEAFV